MDEQETTPIAKARQRIPSRFAGEVRRIRIQPESAVPTLEVQIDDGTGRIQALFLGRRNIQGITCGRRLAIEGTPVDTAGRGLTIYNPLYELM